MRYKTAQLRRAWNAAAKSEHRIVCDAKELKYLCRDRHCESGRRYFELQSYQSKNGTIQTIEF